MLPLKKTVKNFVAFLLLAALFYAQAAIAHHAPTHLNHILASLVLQADSANPSPEKTHTNAIGCPEGILAQNIQSALSADLSIQLTSRLVYAQPIQPIHNHQTTRLAVKYNPRAPPLFFI